MTHGRSGVARAPSLPPCCGFCFCRHFPRAVVLLGFGLTPRCRVVFGPVSRNYGGCFTLKKFGSVLGHLSLPDPTPPYCLRHVSAALMAPERETPRGEILGEPWEARGPGGDMDALDAGQKFSFSRVGGQVSGDVTTRWFHLRVKKKPLRRTWKDWTLVWGLLWIFYGVKVEQRVFMLRITLIRLLKRRVLKVFFGPDNGNSSIVCHWNE